MYIQPNSTIKIYHSVPLDNKYKNTLYFDTLDEQNEYFHGNMSILKTTLNVNSYQRVDKGLMRVQVKTDSIYDCNYLAFRNTNHGNKWFYAFIVGVDYINEVTSEIRYEIDVMQTYAKDYTLKECMVEREHSVTDNIGENLLPEPLDLGEYVYTDYQELIETRDLAVIVLIADVSGDLEVDGAYIDGTYSGCRMYVFNNTDVVGIDGLLSQYMQKPEAILNIYIIPKILIGIDIPENNRLSNNFVSIKTTLRKQEWKITPSTTIENHTVRNKKLLTYPYNYFNIDNANGSNLSLRYEYFKDLQPCVCIEGTVKNPVSLVLRPSNYKGSKDIDIYGLHHTLNTESIALDNYPLCSWNFDAYKQWVAQNAIPLAIGGVASIFSLAVPSGTMTSWKSSTKNYEGRRIATKTVDEGMSKTENYGNYGFNDIANIMINQYSASIKADVCHGSTNSSNVNVANGKQNFYISRVHIDKQHAEIIDKFFDAYGYSTNLVKIPNVNSRPHWNYVKTAGCNIVGNVPADDISLIMSIYDNGITFWKNPSEVGMYNLDNSPVVQESEV